MYLIKRKSVYYIRFIDESENRQKQFSTRCKNKKEALKFLTNFRAEVKNKRELQYISLIDFKAEYLNHIELLFSPKYHSIVEYTFQKLIESIGNVPLVKLERTILEKYLFDTFKRAKFIASLNYRNLKSSFNYAISRKTISNQTR